MVTSGGAFGGIFAGYIVKASTDWRWVFWMDTIMTATCLLLVVLFLPETNFRRPVHFENGKESDSTLLPVTTIEHKSKLTLWNALSVFRGYDRYPTSLLSTSRMTLTPPLQTRGMGQLLRGPAQNTPIPCCHLGLGHYWLYSGLGYYHSSLIRKFLPPFLRFQWLCGGKHRLRCKLPKNSTSSYS